MTREQFIKQEAAVSRRFMNRHAAEDFSLMPGGVSYAREYRCACGFVTSEAGAIWDHSERCRS